MLNKNLVFKNEKKKDILSTVDFINDHLKSERTGVSNIASGIGDILLTKLYINPEEIKWNIKHLIDYKPYPDNLTSIKFNIELLLKLFKKEQLTIFYNDTVVIQNCLNYTHLVHNYDLTPYFHNLLPKFCFEYIVIHTKVRFRKTDENIVQNTKLLFRSFFESIKFKYKVVILGERKIAKNQASMIIPSMTTIYDECMLLMNHNEVIDLTEPEMYNTPKMETFEHDINIIKNAKCNIGVGHGGQFCFNICFSNNSIFFCPKGLVNNLNIKKNNFEIYDDLNKFQTTITERLSS